MMYGVRKSSRFVFTLRRDCWRKRFPSRGMSPRIGVFETDSTMRSCMMPPMTTVSWSLATTVVLALRLLVVGPSTASCEAISSICSWMTRRT